jgi:hypothetical protein
VTGDEFSAVEFTAKLFGDGRWPSNMAELVEGWISYWINRRDKTRKFDPEDDWASACAWDLVRDNGILGLEFVLAVLAEKPDEQIIGVLAAGPLEDLLGHHSSAIIDRAEEEARRSPEFRHLLGGVWQNQMTDEIWQRVLKAAPERW